MSSDGSSSDTEATAPSTSESPYLPATMEGLFEQIVAWIRDTPVTKDMYTSTDTKLRMYGLYKHVHDGPCQGEKPSVLRVEALYKYKAYKLCHDLSKEEAMEQYIQVAGAQDNWLGKKILKQYQEWCTAHGKSASMAVIPSTRSGSSSKLAMLGFQPVVPRGEIDIAFADLFFAMSACFALMPSLRSNEKAIQGHFAHIETHEAVVGLSARTLMDLYFTAKKYPKGSQVIMSPAINVPGVAAVLKHHDIEIIPIDLPMSEGGSEAPRIAVDCDAIERAVTAKTVAIMIVHPFGTPSASEEEMLRINKLAEEQNLNLIEDAAECFTGLSKEAFQPSPLADVTLFSFGWIKTSTALGGGVALVKEKEVAKDMNRVQHSSFPTQSTRVILWRAFKGMVIKLLTSSSIVYGLMALLLKSVGLSLDTVVCAAIRGFSAPKAAERVREVRQRPCAALLSVLDRRLKQCRKNMVASADARQKRCGKVLDIMRSSRPEMVGHLLEQSSTFWLFPIRSKDPRSFCRKLRARGYDVTCGMSQLHCIAEASECPQAFELMDKAVYLPISSRHMSESELKRLAQTISIVEGEITAPATAPVKQLSSKRVWRGPAAVAMLSMSLCSWQYLLTIALTATQVCACLVLGVGILAAILRRSIADWYIDQSSTFVKYSRMLTEDGAASGGEDQTRVLSAMDVLQIPACSSKDFRKVFLTGATGFVGSTLLRDLLVNRKTLSIEAVILLCRPKRGSSARSRVDKLLAEPQFSFLSEEEKKLAVQVVEGEVAEPNVGLNASDLEMIVSDAKITHVIHCAASVSFTQELPDAARTNIASSLHLQKLTSMLISKTATFVHVSTAFVHGGDTGTASEPLPEKLYSLGKFDPARLYSSMLGSQFYAAKAMHELGFHNSYTFSKCVCEHLLSRNASVRTMVIRPSIVGPAVETPWEGWAGAKPSTLVAAACLYMAYQWNLWSFGNHRVPCIPVDVLSSFIVAKVFADVVDEVSEAMAPVSIDDSDSAGSSAISFEKIKRTDSSASSSSDSWPDVATPIRALEIHNAAWNDASPDSASFTWVHYAAAVCQVGAITGYFSRPTAFLGLIFTKRVAPWASLSLESFRRLHSLIVDVPFKTIQRLGTFLGFDTSMMKKLSQFLDLPLLFYPFMNAGFHFESELTAPDELDGQRYTFCCTAAAHRFMVDGKKKMASKAGKPFPDSTDDLPYLRVAGSLHQQSCQDSWWALTQPRGGYFVRFAGWFIIKILRATCSEVTVDVETFRAIVSQFESESEPVTIIIAPTHRSFLDFIVLSFVLFAVPELKVQIPYIAAADDFERLPFIGWLATRLGAFFVRRGRKHEDPQLRENLSSIAKSAAAQSPVVEVFIEGTRSRDRRFNRPKTGFLRCIQDQGRMIVVPITINYERMPDQDALTAEATGGLSRGLNVSSLVKWLREASAGKVDLGRIHVVAGSPIVAPYGTNQLDARVLADEIQRRQQEHVYVSKYHIDAASKLLALENTTIEKALRRMGCLFWPDTGAVESSLDIPSDETELLTLLLQVSPHLARLFVESHPSWASWLNRLAQPAAEDDILEDDSVREVVDSMVSMFDEADRCTEQALFLLKAKGFDNPKPEHALQTALSICNNLPHGLVRASLSMQLQHVVASYDETMPTITEGAVTRQRIPGSDEALGFWGFHDSSFVVQTDTHGSPYVTMQGKRYTLSNARMKKILPFIQEEMKVKVDLFREAFLDNDKLDFPGCRISSEGLELLKPSQVDVSFEERVRHGTGHCQEDVFAIRSGQLPRVPDAVVWPKTEAEVENVVRLAKERSWCIIPFGGGTNVSLATRCPPLEVEPRPILSVDMRKMSKILWVDEENGLARVEAGITGRQLVEEMAERGYTIGHEPDSIEFSTLGGWVATKASGMKRNKYGNIEDIVKSVRVVSAEGILQHGKDGDAVWGREASGMDLCSVMFGSEGCLGIVTSATLRIWPEPEVRDYDGFIFPDFEMGVRFARGVSKLGTRMPASVRVLDNEHFRLGQALRPNSTSPLETVVKPIVQSMLHKFGNFESKKVTCATIGYEGSKDEVCAQRKALSELAKEHGGIRLGSRVGKDGYNLTFMIAYLRDFAMTYHFLGESFETFVPWSKVQLVVERTKERIYKEHSDRCLPGRPFVGARVTQLYHEGACIYFYFCMNFENVTDPSQVYSDIEHAARHEIIVNGGSVSHHHGIGKVRTDFLKDINSSAFRSSVQGFKRGVDPSNIFGARNSVFSSEE